MKLIKLEALRGFAALYVVLHHSLPHYWVLAGVNIGGLLRFGQEAVILFFLLSGFVINYAFETGKDKTFRSYFLKRFSRIYLPLTLIMLLGYLIVCARAGNFVDPELSNLGLNLLMLQDIGSLKPNTIVEPYLHNAPLWSLSYEWWFYMLFFPVCTYFKTEKAQSDFVFGLAIISAVAYVIHPNFVFRLLMYVGIWWAGVYLSRHYLRGLPMDFKALKRPILCLLAVCLILFAKVLAFISSGENASIGISPFLELRHVAFALSMIIAAILWNKYGWVGFNYTLKPFAKLAPISYVIYISHYYLVTDASYLSFIGNDYLEWLGYLVCLLVFSYTLEVILYPLLQRKFLKATMRQA